MKEKIIEALSALFPALSKGIVEKMAEACVKVQEEVILTEKYGQFAMRLTPQTLANFDEIVKISHLNSGYYDHYANDAKANTKLFTPAFGESEELVLYWEGENQLIPSEDLHSYLKAKGYEVVGNPHPSLLVLAANILTEERLSQLGIPKQVNIVLPSAFENSFRDGAGDQCFPCMYRGTIERAFAMSKTIGNRTSYSAFLVRKMLT